jgi:hypothetical protein
MWSSLLTLAKAMVRGRNVRNGSGRHFYHEIPQATNLIKITRLLSSQFGGLKVQDWGAPLLLPLQVVYQGRRCGHKWSYLEQFL